MNTVETTDPTRGARHGVSRIPRWVIALLAAVGSVSAIWAAVMCGATYTLNGGIATQSNQTYTASAADQSAVWVTNSGVLTPSQSHHHDYQRLVQRRQ